MSDKTIVGRSIIDGGETEWAAAMDYFDIVCRTTTSRTRDNDGRAFLQPNTCYISSGADGLYCPKARIKGRIDFDHPQERRYNASYSKKFRIYRTEVFEDTVIFKYASQTFYQAIWYAENKSLLFANYWDYDFFMLVLNWLSDNGCIKRKSEENLATETIVEIHQGQVEMVTAPKKSIRCKVGADPEFEVVRNGKVIRPPSYYRGIDTPIGLDGAGSQIELRPNPGTPSEVVNNLKELFKQLKDPVSVIGDCYPLGGHIHVGCGREVYPTSEMLWLLDYFMGNNTITLSGLSRGSYAKKSACESKRWGFEYRSPSAAIFANPRFAELAMKIVMNVTENYINKRVFRVNIPTPTYEEFLNYCDFDEKDFNDWTTELSAYKQFMRSPDRYSLNISHLWDESIPAETNWGVPCPRKRSGASKCDDPNCYYCNTNWRENDDNDEDIDTINSAIGRILRRDTSPVNDEAMVQYRSYFNQLSEMNVGVNDDWDVNVLRNVLALFAHCGVRRFTYNVFLFGLRAGRGMVTAGYSIPGYERTSEFGEDNHSYGVARQIRMGADDAALILTINEIVNNEPHTRRESCA